MIGSKLHPSRYDGYEAAEADEPIFVLLARDITAPSLVREWIARRLRSGNLSQDQADEANDIANAMETWRRVNRPLPEDFE